MNDYEFNICYDKWINSNGGTPFWPELAVELKYPNGEVLRCTFKRERKRRGITKYNAKPLIVNPPKILIFDIETTPMLCFTWGIWEQNINIDAIVEDFHILSWAGKWLFDTTVHSDVLTHTEAINHDDKRIVQSMWDMLDKADILIAHNGNKFDIKKLNTRFIKHELNRPSPYRSIDTLCIARKMFNFSSNKLDYINKFLGLEQKDDTDFQLWIDCFNGKEEALQKMLSYNKNDVIILEELYIKIRNWIPNHPNMNLYFNQTGKSMCPNCGSKNLKSNGNYTTQAGVYESLRCNDCGAIGRGKVNKLSKDKRKSIVNGV